MSDKTELLPCPFCGGKAHWPEPEVNIHYVGCMSCAACATGVEDWNRRTALAEQPAPAAPVAVGQEPVRELIGYACDRRGALIPDRCGDCLCWPAYEDASPAAEQPRPDGCPCNNASGPCENCDSAEQLHPLEQFTDACGRLHSACNKAREKLADMEAAEQPGTVAVPRELLEELADIADAMQCYDARDDAIALLGKESEA